ncbi:MAG: CHASE3 domain-containing protein [Cytophagaceae bacterium]|nr:CHASE3 domain-containing protein [Cytophagaceae bacterium]
MKYSLLFLRLTFVVAIGILVGLTLLAFRQFHSLMSESDRVDHTYQVLLKLEEVVSLVKDAETSQRGFLVTHDPKFLAPFHASYPRVERAYESLDTLTSDSPVQNAHIDTLWGQIEHRYETLNRGILYDTSRVSNGKGSMLSALNLGKLIMDSLRNKAALIRSEELELLRYQNLSKTDTARLTPYYLLALAAIALILLSASFLVINQELRRRLEAKKELEQKVEVLNRSNAELEQFAYVASHDLQEPLRKIRAFGNKLVLRHRTGLDDEGRELLDKIESAAARMQKLIDDLLGFSRLVRPLDDQVPTDLNQVLTEVISDLSESIQNSKADLRVACLPTLNGYPTQMRQLFQNLLGNALKFSRTDLRPRIRVEYALLSGNEVPPDSSGRRINTTCHRISVIDNGIGFEPQYVEKIFVIFQRLHGRSEFTGTGIGLAICKRVVTNHGGFIEAQGKPGEGATFNVYLPVRSPEQPA